VGQWRKFAQYRDTLNVPDQFDKKSEMSRFDNAATPGITTFQILKNQHGPHTQRFPKPASMLLFESTYIIFSMTWIAWLYHPWIIENVGLPQVPLTSTAQALYLLDKYVPSLEPSHVHSSF